MPLPCQTSDSDIREFYAPLLDADPTATNAIWSWTTDPSSVDSARIRIALGDALGAIKEFGAAIEWCRNHGFRGSLTWCCTELAILLLERDDPGDREKAIELQGETLAIAQELGMKPLLERVLRSGRC